MVGLSKKENKNFKNKGTYKSTRYFHIIEYLLERMPQQLRIHNKNKGTYKSTRYFHIIEYLLECMPQQLRIV